MSRQRKRTSQSLVQQPNKPVVFTIGYAGRMREDFLKILKDHQIEVIVDVRRWPTSKQFPDFVKERMMKWVPESGLEYVWMGDVLGGYRKGGYASYMQTEEYQKAIKQLAALARKKRVCLLCVERTHRACHRRFIAQSLLQLGFRVIHLEE